MNKDVSTYKYNVKQQILVALDCVIFGFDGKRLKLLLFKRKMNPNKGCWSLIGAFVKDDLTVSETAKEVLLETTGLEEIHLEQLKCYSTLDRDPGGRVISIAHYSLIRINELEEALVEEHEAHWFDIDDLPELNFDHKIMVEDALVALRNRAKRQPLGQDLLPKYFTIPQLQALYESVCNRSLDSRNFRKKIFSFDILVKTDKKDKSSSKKGAFLYKFNKFKFEKLLAVGGNFDL